MSAPATSLTSKDFKGDRHPIWCPGCGDFGVLSALYNALAAAQLNPKDVVVVSGIGCSGRTPGFVRSYGFHSIHGRVLPISLGVKAARPSLKVIGVGGDGDGFAIGGGHIAHAARRNPDMVYIVMDNQVYGLTKGQYSPTSSERCSSGSSPYGNQEIPINPLAMLISYGAGFVGQGYAGKPKELTGLICRAMAHRGFAFLNVISPCVTFNNTYKIITPRVVEVPSGHDVSNRIKAFELSLQTDRIWMGVLYEGSRHTFEDGIAEVIQRAQATGPSRLEEMIQSFA